MALYLGNVSLDVNELLRVFLAAPMFIALEEQFIDI